MVSAMSARIGRELCAGIIASAWVLSASIAEARVDFTDRQSPGEVQSTSLIGAPVLNMAGETIGKVSYLLLDGSGRVTTAVLGVGGFLGIGEKNVGVPFASLKTEAEDGKTTFRLDATRSDIEAAPSFVWAVDTTLARGGGASDATKDREPMSDAVESDSVKKKTDQPEAQPNATPGAAPGASQPQQQ